MSFLRIPPAGVPVDVGKGVQAAEAVFAANRTAPEIAIFGLRGAHRVADKRR